MHRLPKLSALNWLRLAAIPAGKDWRALPPAIRLPPRDQRLNGGFGVNDAKEPAHTVVAEGSVRNTWASVADPRLRCTPRPAWYRGSFLVVYGMDMKTTRIVERCDKAS